MECYSLKQSDVPALIDHLGAYGEVIAPHRKGDVSYSFEPVKDSEKVVLEYNRTLLPLKKCFLPPTEKLMDFSLKDMSYKPTEVPIKPAVYFGIHSYEMQSILRLDHSMLSGKAESNYFNRRKKSRFIGVSFSPDEYHFSESVGISIEEMEGFDLYLNKVSDDYQLYIISDKGKDLLKGFDKLIQAEPIHVEGREFNKKIRYHYNRLPRVFQYAYHSKVWAEVAERCVGCGSCNLTCPTCFCFDVNDQVEVTAEDGMRRRSWDSCMLSTFAEVAGGENFREHTLNRTRHRLYRKFKYITDEEGLPWCVGCGRCTAFCPADISMVDIINDLIREDEKAQFHKTVRV
ncbi:MAG: 4Fe-4S dicluster domain-containing protein [Candidatus Marinimicrobia bacterium]|nr:4Fe-4S dicluster domain-containing protein [Candidatus Neomarinimicrobiota bacterium]MCF7850572.1 4Fe-4S dicluster domain-containing protein [Candidatus Neomarinimicrobiota bacterium]MCF7903694.1 4Fe-4S dicluster domain-containing protein [Candidatus Neomarinimicrobiota bacterium]